MTIKGGPINSKIWIDQFEMKIIFDRFKEYFFRFDVPYLWLSIIKNETIYHKMTTKHIEEN